MLWKCKTAHDADEVLHLLNGEKRFDLPVPDARVCMTWRGDHPQFWVFARSAGKSGAVDPGAGEWGWWSGDSTEGVLDLLRGGQRGEVPVAAQVAGAWTGDRHVFYCFYRRPPAGSAPPVDGDWEVASVTGAAGTLAFLNGAGASSPLAAARLAAVHREHRDEFFVFHRRGGGRDATWSWRSVGSAEEVRRAVQPAERPAAPVAADFQVAASPAAPGAFHVFMAPAAVRTPLPVG